jgi:thiol-disulfide isomerase/thioredoxin
MDPKVLPDDKVAKIGIEVITPESHRFTAIEAAEQARKLGIEVLPYAEVGKAFDFTLTTTEGKQIRSGDLRGKVIVVDCWATWCAPCMMLLPEVKELYQKHRQDGLEVIGINLDNEVGKVKKVCETMSLSWPQVIVAADEKQRDLWYEAAGIQSPISPVEMGHRACSTCLIHDIAMVLKRKLYWDPVTERFKNDDVANSMTSRPQRTPYMLA